LVKPGDSVKQEDPLVTLESEKATVDVPAPAAGVVREVKAKVGDKVSEGSVICTLEVEEKSSVLRPPSSAPAQPEAQKPLPVPAPAAAQAEDGRRKTEDSSPPPGGDNRLAHAGPGVRRFARELGVDVLRVTGTGPKGRVLKEDVQGFVKGQLASPAP